MTDSRMRRSNDVSTGFSTAREYDCSALLRAYAADVLDDLDVRAPEETQRVHRPRARGWAAPLAAALVAAVVVSASALLHQGSGKSGGPDLPIIGPTLTPGAPIDVAWADLAPAAVVIPEYERRYVPDPSAGSALPVCQVSQLRARSSTVTQGNGRRVMTITFSLLSGRSCLLVGYPEVTETIEGGIIVPALPRPVTKNDWPGQPTLSSDERVTISLVYDDGCGASPDLQLGLLGGSLTVDGFGPLPPCPDGRTSGGTTELGPFQPEHWRLERGGRSLEPMQERLVDYDAVANAVVLELTATDHDLSLESCPDVRIGNAGGSGSVQTFQLNCPGVTPRDDRGLPYLPKNVPVRFTIALKFEPTNRLTWLISAPGQLPMSAALPAG
jgi:hypothetical protein